MNDNTTTSHDAHNIDHQDHVPLNDISASHDSAPPTYNPAQAQNEKSESALPRQPEPTHPMAYPNNPNTIIQSFGPTVTIRQLESAPAPVQCPICHRLALTRVDFHSGGTTYGWAALGCFICAIPLACIPFGIDATKNVDHMCGNCGTKLATWHRSGRTEVWAHEGMQAAPVAGNATMKK